MKRIRWPGILAAAAVVFQAAATAADPPEGEAPTELDRVTVTGQVPMLDRQTLLLRALWERSTPCLGCDAPPPGPALPEVLLRYLLLPAVPPDVDEADRLAFEVKLQSAPDLEYLRR